MNGVVPIILKLCNHYDRFLVFCILVLLFSFNFHSDFQQHQMQSLEYEKAETEISNSFLTNNSDLKLKSTSFQESSCFGSIGEFKIPYQIGLGAIVDLLETDDVSIFYLAANYEKYILIV